MAVVPSTSAAEEPDPDSSVQDQDKHFATDHLLSDLKARSYRGGSTVVISQVLKIAIKIGSTVLLARLLAPSDFGLVALVTAVTGFVQLFKDAGLSMATVQREHVTHAQISTLFWANMALSFIATAAIAGLAPVIAGLYEEPRLLGITWVLSGTMIFGGAAVQHQALLRRQMRFVALSVTEVVSMLIGAAVALAMAAFEFGYWSLIGAMAATSISGTAITWYFCKWRPGLPRRGSGARSMLHFGSGIAGSSLLGYCTRNADTMIVGYSLGSSALGIYHKAFELLMFPVRSLNVPISGIMLPVLSRLQGDPERFRNAYLKAVSSLALIGMPFVAVVYVLSDDIVSVALGPPWEEVGTIFRWLAPAAAFGSIYNVPAWLCISLGRPHVQLLWVVITAPISVLAYWVGAQFGLTGVAMSLSLSWSFSFVLFAIMACKGSPVRVHQLFFAVVPQSLCTGIAIVAGAVAFSLVTGWVSSPYVRLPVVLFIITLAYLAGCFLIPQSRILCLSLIREGLASSLRSAGDQASSERVVENAGH